MTPPTPQQQLLRRRIEGVIGFAAPLFDLVLATGDRVSRLVSPEDEYVPIRPPSDAFALGAARDAGTRPAPGREISD